MGGAPASAACGFADRRGLIREAASGQHRAASAHAAHGNQPMQILMTDDQLLRAAERICYKNTPQGELNLFLLRPVDGGGFRPRPTIVYFTGGGWREGLPHQMIANAAWFRDRGLIGIAADYRV